MSTAASQCPGCGQPTTRVQWRNIVIGVILGSAVGVVLALVLMSVTGNSEKAGELVAAVVILLVLALALLPPVLYVVGVVRAGRSYIRTGSRRAAGAVCLLLLVGVYGFALSLSSHSDNACSEHAPHTEGEGPSSRQSFGLLPPGVRCTYFLPGGARAHYVGGYGNLVVGGVPALIAGSVIAARRADRDRPRARKEAVA